ncbi:hypothetical protein BYT27DRAFT_7195328 [Phlegmacium glaucopus]|nr:hypothetical protein BYT27DRAFT_7195328 [Phlegmacium glaucopus]
MSVQSVDDTGSGISYSGSYTISTTSEQSVDDTDPSISYSGSWNTYQLHDALVYHGTIHSTTQNGASATLTFQGLNAVGVNLVKPVCSGFVAGSWTRDGQTGKVGIPCTSDIQEDYPLYPYTAGSSFGLNTIIVRNAGSVPFQLDRFILGNVTNDTPSSTTPGTPPSTTTISSISTAAISSNSPVVSNLPISGVTSPSSNSTDAAGIATALNAGSPSAGVISPQLTGVSKDAPSSSSPRALPLGPIIGGALGALALLLLFIFLLIKYRPWKREKSNWAETVPSSTLTPFNMQETPVGYFGSDEKTAALGIAEPSFPSTSGQSSHICSPRAQSDINDNPTENTIHTSQERGPLDPASPSTLTPENRASLAPSYSPDRPFQSGFSNVSASCAADGPPAYHSLNIPPGSEAQPIP